MNGTYVPPRLHLVRKFRDPVIREGYVRLSEVAAAVVDTPYFQRLRYLNQLGIAQYVYPSATHTRFAHSLGVAHRARELLAVIAERQPELLVGPRDLLVVELAGLCHDLGHGPLCHSFESQVVVKMEKAGELQNENEDGGGGGAEARKWSHESMSVAIFDLICDEYRVDITESERQRVKDLILNGRVPRKADWPDHLEFMFDIVANHRNGLDVDRLDYLERDNVACGALTSVDFSLLLDSARVIAGEICFRCPPSVVAGVYHARSLMHEHVYQHPVLKGIEYMVTDAIYLARKELGLKEAVVDPVKFCSLDDTILRQLQVKLKEEDSKKLLERLAVRDLYKFCGSVQLPADLADIEVESAATPQGLADCWNSAVLELCEEFDSENARLEDGSRIVLQPEDLRVARVKISWTPDGTNPLKAVGFWETVFDKKPLRRLHSKFHPAEYVSREIRVYLVRASASVKEQKAYIAAARNSLLAFNQLYLGSSDITSPIKSAVSVSARKKVLPSRRAIHGIDDDNGNNHISLDDAAEERKKRETPEQSDHLSKPELLVKTRTVRQKLEL